MGDSYFEIDNNLTLEYNQEQGYGNNYLDSPGHFQKADQEFDQQYNPTSPLLNDENRYFDPFNDQHEDYNEQNNIDNEKHQHQQEGTQVHLNPNDLLIKDHVNNYEQGQQDQQYQQQQLSQSIDNQQIDQQISQQPNIDFGDNLQNQSEESMISNYYDLFNPNIRRDTFLTSYLLPQVQQNQYQFPLQLQQHNSQSLMLPQIQQQQYLQHLNLKQQFFQDHANQQYQLPQFDQYNGITFSKIDINNYNPPQMYETNLQLNHDTKIQNVERKQDISSYETQPNKKFKVKEEQEQQEFDQDQDIMINQSQQIIKGEAPKSFQLDGNDFNLKNYYKNIMKKAVQNLIKIFEEKGEKNIVQLIKRVFPLNKCNNKHFLLLFNHLQQNSDPSTSIVNKIEMDYDFSQQDLQMLEQVREVAQKQFSNKFYYLTRLYKAHKASKNIEQFYYGAIFYAERATQQQFSSKYLPFKYENQIFKDVQSDLKEQLLNRQNENQFKIKITKNSLN